MFLLSVRTSMAPSNAKQGSCLTCNSLALFCLWQTTCRLWQMMDASFLRLKTTTFSWVSKRAAMLAGEDLHAQESSGAASVVQRHEACVFHLHQAHEAREAREARGPDESILVA